MSAIYTKVLNLKCASQCPEGLAENEIQEVSEKCKASFGCEIPTGYADFLRKANGFIFNGYSVFCYFNDKMSNLFPRYAGDDFFKVNTLFSDVTEYLLLGQSSLDFLGYDKVSKKYLILSNETSDIRCESLNFKEILEQFFKV